MHFVREEKTYNGMKKYLFACEKCGNVISTFLKDTIPICKCDEIGKVYGNLMIRKNLNNHLFECECLKCRTKLVLELDKIKTYKRCIYCEQKEINDDFLVRVSRTIKVGEFYGALEVLEDRDIKYDTYNCLCHECGEVKKIAKNKLNSINKRNSLLCCDSCDKKTKFKHTDMMNQLKSRYIVSFTLNDLTEFMLKIDKENKQVLFEKDRPVRSIFGLGDFIIK